MGTLRRYFRLAPFERQIVFQCSVGLVMTRVGLRLVGFSLWKKVATGLASFDRARSENERVAYISGAITRMQATAERHLFFRPNCLEHALVLWWLLRRHGILANIRIGGRKEHGRFEAHAWVEVEGIPLGDADGAHRNFVPFDGPVPLMENQAR